MLPGSEIGSGEGHSLPTEVGETSRYRQQVKFYIGNVLFLSFSFFKRGGRAEGEREF